MRDDRDEQIARIEEGLQKLDALIERRIAEIQRRDGDSPLSNVEDYLDDAEIVELDETRKAVRERVDALKKSLPGSTS
jgi:DNA-binding ferritin-like protein